MTQVNKAVIHTSLRSTFTFQIYFLLMTLNKFSNNFTRAEIQILRGVTEGEVRGGNDDMHGG